MCKLGITITDEVIIRNTDNTDNTCNNDLLSILKNNDNMIIAELSNNINMTLYDDYYLYISFIVFINNFDLILSNIDSICIKSGIKIKIGIYVDNIDQVIYLRQTDYFNKIKNILINDELIEDDEIQTMYFIGKNICAKNDINNDDNKNKYQALILNPIVHCICINKYVFENIIPLLNTKILYQYQIKNTICHINISKIIKYYSTPILSIEELLIKLIMGVKGYFLIYNIKKLPMNSEKEIKDLYYNISKLFGEISTCRPVNNIEYPSEQVRDIRPIIGSNHYFSSNNRQPLHTDCAYESYEKSCDWVMLYSLEVSEFGGITSFLYSNTLAYILRKYEQDLFLRLDRNVSYKYNDENGEYKNIKKLFDMNDNIINWNKFQLHNDNDKETFDICDELFDVLERKIVGGQIFDFNKKWEKGDCVVFNDHLILHCRSYFYGNRWLKSLEIFDNLIKLK